MDTTLPTDPIASKSRIPLGIGDEQCGLGFFRDLMQSQSADVIRLDTPVLGGITPALRVIAMADAFGLPVSPYDYPKINIHLAAAFSCQAVKPLHQTNPARAFALIGMN